jgi:predicted unusual protein kinase regulating ubiquinone biosynthesis (AarF/ABC1/UbiB family)
LEVAFPVFQTVPLGAASVAQVHRATLADGTPVAVKVQYPWIRASLPADLKVLRGLTRILLRFASRGRWRADFERFFAEFAEGLAEELDFEAEARAAGEIAANLSGDPGVHVPQVIASHTRTRVLCMTYHPCVNITDRAALETLGVAPAKVLEIVVRAYAKQIFEDGLFHADPHPGNLFVLDEEGASENPRVLFVDFGLHRRLSPELRNEMRQGIFALMQRDVDRFVERMKALDMIAPGAESGVRSAVSQMLERIADRGGTEAWMGAAGGQVLSLKNEAKRLLQETPGLQLPNDLLLYAKTLAYLFALGEEIDRDVDLMKLSVPYLLQFLAARD